MLPSKYPRQIPARRPTPPFHDPLSGRDMRSAGAEDGDARALQRCVKANVDQARATRAVTCRHGSRPRRHD